MNGVAEKARLSSFLFIWVGKLRSFNCANPLFVFPTRTFDFHPIASSSDGRNISREKYATESLSSYEFC